MTTLSHGSERPPLILIVDPDAARRRASMVYFAGEGFRVAGASSGDEALRKAVASPPDLVLTDLVLRGLDGWELIWHLRKRWETRHARILVCTSVGLPGCRRRAVCAGCDEIMGRPSCSTVLLGAVNRLLHQNPHEEDPQDEPDRCARAAEPRGPTLH